MVVGSGGQRRSGGGGDCDDESERSEDADDGVLADEDGVIEVMRVDDEDDELQWHEVIDAVLHVGGALAKEKQRRLLERRKKGLHRKTPSSVTIEHIQEDSAE